METFYQILGVDKKADPKDIKKAYRKLALKHHPDRGGDDATFKKIGRAYDVLSDENKRKIYDTKGEEGLKDFEQGSNDIDPTEIFANFFQQQRHNQNEMKLQVVIPVQVTLDEIFTGRKKIVEYERIIDCDSCDSTGSIDKNSYICNKCDGTGFITITRQIGPMTQRGKAP